MSLSVSEFTIEFQGCTFSYRIQGAGEAVVFIQGVGLHGDGWSSQVDALKTRYRCLSFDNRGMAQSQPAAVPISVEQMALDTLAVMDAAGIGWAHIVGHSLGGCIGQQIAIDHPERVKSLALLCTSSRGADATRLTWKMVWLGARSRIGTGRMRRMAFLQIVLSAPHLASQNRDEIAERLAPIFGHDLADTPSIVTLQLGALKSFNSASRLKGLTGIPTLVVSAAYDVIFPPKYGRALAEAISGAHFHLIADAAHGATIERKDEVNDLIAQHIEAAIRKAENGDRAAIV